MLISSKAAEGETVAMGVVAPGVDVGTAEEEVAGGRAGVGEPRPVGAVGTAIEVTVDPAEVPASNEGKRYIFYQSS